MKLLFDEHLPKSMIRRVGDLWPGSSHVLLCGLGSTDDDIIREYALAHGYVIVTKDNDFYVSSVI